MAMMECSTDLQQLCSRIQEFIAPFAGRVDYGNLRSRVSDWDCGDGEPVTNVALVYETPGGSTDQINISYYHESGAFALIDVEGERTTRSVDVVIESISPRISGIPQKRRDALQAEIRRLIDGGSSTTAGLFGHLNRILQSDFKGGTITHLEFRDAMTYAVQYMKEQGSAPK